MLDGHGSVGLIKCVWKFLVEGDDKAMIAEKMQEGIRLAENFLSTARISFSELKPSELPEKPGVYAIFCRDTGETLYVGRTKNIRQRLHRQHLNGTFSNARLKKYLVEDPKETDIPDINAAKHFLLDNCYFQYIPEPDIRQRGQIEGLLGYLLNVRYIHEEH